MKPISIGNYFIRDLNDPGNYFIVTVVFIVVFINIFEFTPDQFSRRHLDRRI